MAEAKFISFILWFLGVPLWSWALWVNIGTWKSDILFFAGLLVIGFNGYWRWRRQLRIDRKSAQEERLREIEILERTKNLN